MFVKEMVIKYVLIKAISLAVDSKQRSIIGLFLTVALSILQGLTNNKLPHLAETLQLRTTKFITATGLTIRFQTIKHLKIND